MARRTALPLCKMLSSPNFYPAYPSAIQSPRLGSLARTLELITQYFNNWNWVYNNIIDQDENELSKLKGGTCSYSSKWGQRANILPLCFQNPPKRRKKERGRDRKSKRERKKKGKERGSKEKTVYPIPLKARVNLKPIIDN